MNLTKVAEAVARVTPKTGFNVVEIDDFSFPPDLNVVGHFATRPEALTCAARHEAESGFTTYIYGSSDERKDYSPDQERDHGKFSGPGGGGAGSAQGKLGLSKGPAAEAAGYDASREGDNRIFADHDQVRKYGAEVFNQKNPVDGLGRWTLEGRGQVIQQNERDILVQQDPDRTAPPNTLGGQQFLDDFGVAVNDPAAKELNDRIYEALKNNAAMGQAGTAPEHVVAGVRVAMAQEKIENDERQRVVNERLAKLAGLKAERDAVFKLEADKREVLQRARDAVSKTALAREDREHEQGNYDKAARYAREAHDDAVGENAPDTVKKDLEAKMYATMNAASKFAEVGDVHQAAFEKARGELQKANDDFKGPHEAAEALRKKLSPERTSSPESRADLQTKEIFTTKPLGGGTSLSLKAQLEDGTNAVYKPANGEGHGLRSNVETGTFYLRETASSIVAKQLGVEDLVPATVTMTGPKGIGSLQAFVPNSETLQDTYDASFNRDDAERMRTFDYITGNSDRHERNVMVTEDKDGEQHPILIDNGLAFPNGKPDRVITPWRNMPHEPLSEKQQDFIKKIDHVQLASTLVKAGIENEAVYHTIARAHQLIAQPQIIDASESSTCDYDFREVPDTRASDRAYALGVMNRDEIRAARGGGDFVPAKRIRQRKRL